MDLISIYETFPTQADCVKYLEHLRWSGSPVCPYCKMEYSTPLHGENRHHCNSCNTSFSVTVNTPFHRSRLPLPKWFLALCLVVNGTERISVRELAERIEVNKDTACLVLRKIRRGMFENRELLYRIVENVNLDPKGEELC